MGGPETYQAAESLRRMFAQVSGLATRHASIELTKDGRFRLQFDGTNSDGSRFSISSELIFVERFKKTTKKLAILQKNNVMEKTGQEIAAINDSGKPMTESGKTPLESKGKAFAARIKKFRADHDADIDRRSERYDELLKRRAEISRRMDAVEAADLAELETIDEDLRKMGNDL